MKTPTKSADPMEEFRKEGLILEGHGLENKWPIQPFESCRYQGYEKCLEEWRKAKARKRKRDSVSSVEDMER